MPVADAPGATDTPQSTIEAPASAIYATYGVGFASNGVAMMLKVIIPLWAIELQFSASQIGIAIGLSALMPFLFSIHGGVLMDRLGTRRVTMAYGLTTTLLCPLYPVFPFFAAVLVLQLITGLTSSMVWVGAQSLIVRYTKGKTSLIARFSVAARCGTLLGPVAIGAIWDLAGPWGAFFFVGGAGLLVLVALFMVPDTHEIEQAAAEPTKTRLKDLIPKWQDYAGAFSLLAARRACRQGSRWPRSRVSLCLSAAWEPGAPSNQGCPTHDRNATRSRRTAESGVLGRSGVVSGNRRLFSRASSPRGSGSAGSVPNRPDQVAVGPRA